MKQNYFTQILKILEVFKGFSHKKLEGITKDFQFLFKTRSKFKLGKNYFFLLTFWQSHYTKAERRLSDLTLLWKKHWRSYIENKNQYLNLTTLIDAKTLTPIDPADQVKDMKPPVFDEQNHKHQVLKEGVISEQNLAPSLSGLKGKPTQLTASLLGMINKLAHNYFSKAEKEMLSFRVFPEKLPEVVSDTKDRPEPKRQNVLGYMGLKWEISLYVAYFCAVTSEQIVFVNIGQNVLYLSSWKSWAFSIVITAVSYLLALHFFRYILNFLRSKDYVPKLYKLFLSLVVAYILAAGWLSFQSAQNRQLQSRYLVEMQTLNNLQMRQFTDVTDTSLANEIAKQQLRVDSLGSELDTPSETTTIISAILFILMGCMSLLTAGILLAVLLCVSKVNSLKRATRKSDKAIISVEAEYDWRISQFRKSRELMASYILELGRLQAIESLMVSTPTLQELIPTKEKSPNTPPPTSSKTAETAKEIEVNDAQDILSEENYSELYNQ